MGIAIIWAIITIVGVVLCIIDYYTDKLGEFLCGVSLSCVVASVIAFVLMLGGFLDSHIDKDLRYKNWEKEYKGLEARIIVWNGGGEDEGLWEDVEKYNAKLELHKKCASNFFINWYCEQECNKFELFEIPPHERSKK